MLSKAGVILGLSIGTYGKAVGLVVIILIFGLSFCIVLSLAEKKLNQSHLINDSKNLPKENSKFKSTTR